MRGAHGASLWLIAGGVVDSPPRSSGALAGGWAGADSPPHSSDSDLRAIGRMIGGGFAVCRCAVAPTCESGDGRLGPDGNRVYHPGLEVCGVSSRPDLSELDVHGVESEGASSRKEGGSDVVGGGSAGALTGLKSGLAWADMLGSWRANACGPRQRMKLRPSVNVRASTVKPTVRASTVKPTSVS